MILYGSTFSPFVRKVVAFAAEKGLDLDVQAVRLGDDNPDFRAASPFGKMPALKDGDFLLADSSAIVHFLEAKAPEPNLIPTDPKARGRTIWFDEWADTLLFGCGRKMFFNRVVAPRFLGREGNVAEADAAEADELPPLLAYLEGVIPDSGYLVEDRLTLADIAVASPFANLAHCGVTVDAARYPKVAAYAASILARPSFAQAVDKESAFLNRLAAAS
jgi:glutathione S-transferase